jgi:hypothetical protein
MTPMTPINTDETMDEDDDDMRAEYDFSDGIPNPYAQRFQELNLVSLDADVKAAFPDSKSVNEALRVLIKAAKSAQEPAKNAQDLAKAS